MLTRLLKTVTIVVLGTAVGLWALDRMSTPAYTQGCCGDGGKCGGSCGGSCGSGCGGHAGHDTGSAGHSQHEDAASNHAGHGHPVDGTQSAPPHGGQLTTAKPLAFEVVYLPQEIRVYIFDVIPNPESAKDVTGEVSLQRPHDQQVKRIALRYVAQPADQQDYLSAPVDLSGAKDGDLTATIKLANLPLPHHPGFTFAQSVAVSKAEPKVALAAIDLSDQAGIARQRVCPVTGAALGSMGGPVKVLVGGQPLYLCCKGCMAKVKSDPELYLTKVSSPQ